jgi:two-component system chemotaxis sensor kinase CheA
LDHLGEIKQTFFQECEEQLSELESGLLSIEDGNYDAETVNAVFRSVHSIKGGAAAFGFDGLVAFVHVFESVLDLMRSNALAPSAPVMKVLLRASDVLSDLVRAARDDAPVSHGDVAEVQANLESLCNPEMCAAAPTPAKTEEKDGDLEFTPVSISLDAIFGDDEEEAPKANSYRIVFKPRPSLYTKANEALRILRHLGELGDTTIECNLGELPFLPEIDPEGAYFSWTIRLTTVAPEAEVRQVFEFVEWDCELDISSDEPQFAFDAEEVPDTAVVAGNPSRAANAGKTTEAEEPKPISPGAPEAGAAASKQNDASQSAQAPQATIRVDLDKVDRLINLVGELVITQAVLSQRVSEAGLSRGSSVAIGLEELEQITRDIQDSVMSIRAQPVKPVFQRMSRIVREVAALTNKSVRLIFEGEGTEVDKTVIERLTDPLTHMVRNAVDHGIESPEARIAAGKPEEGTLRLSAMHKSGQVVIEIADDGSGINRKRVREIAVAKGLVPADALLSDEEIDNLLFLPGFSTNATASSISGRGVGMDVVKRAIQALGGRIATSSRQGLGTTFSMSLPLTLAVLDGMVVTVAGQTLIVPLSAILETLQPRSEYVHSLGVGFRVIGSRNTFIPLIDVGCALRYRVQEADPTTQVALLVESDSGEKCAMLVDAIQGQRQVVIKSLEANYGHVPGIAAATILGDGRVALIVDVDAIINLLRAESQGGGLMAAE